MPLLTLPLGLRIVLKIHNSSPVITTKEILLIGDYVKKIKTLVFSSVTDMLKTIPAEDFQHCYQKWEQRLHRCVATQGIYFEGDNIDLRRKIKLW